MAGSMTFSSDGTKIAYVLWGHGDGMHPVWVMDVDGTDAHEILANDIVMGAGHVRDPDGALAWSPAGDLIALGLEGTIYTFATDGSDFQRVTFGHSPLWSPDGSQVVNRSSATWGIQARSRKMPEGEDVPGAQRGRWTTWLPEPGSWPGDGAEGTWSGTADMADGVRGVPVEQVPSRVLIPPSRCSSSAVVGNRAQLSVLIPSRPDPMNTLSDRQVFIMSTNSAGG
jgi:hypothetical protein